MAFLSFINTFQPYCFIEVLKSYLLHETANLVCCFSNRTQM